jgi:hypothetical protein
MWTLDPLKHYGIYYYLNDIIIATRTMQEHILALRMLLKRLSVCGWKIRLEKCHLVTDKVRFLGMVVSAKGLEPDTERVSVINDRKQPVNQRQVASFVATVNWYCRFVPKFTVLAAPLYNLTKTGIEFKWDTECENSFKEMKRRLMKHTILQFSQTNRPYKIITDWQPSAISHILEQQDSDRTVASDPVWRQKNVKSRVKVQRLYRRTP